MPAARAIDRRIERANRLEHAPVSAQTDRLVGPADDFSDALWREHQRRMAEKLDRLSGDMPRPRIPERDPWALRALVGLLLVVAFAFSGGPLGGRLGDAFRAHGSAEVLPVRIDAWVTPPAYTGKPPVFMTAEANRDQPLFVKRMSEGEMEEVAAVDVSSLRDPQTLEERLGANNAEGILVQLGVCTHLGCVPLGAGEGESKGEYDGYFCPCHGSHYDAAGRIRKGPAPKNLAVPEFAFTSESTIRVG